MWYHRGPEALQVLDNPIVVPESTHDLRHTHKEGLSPPLHQLVPAITSIPNFQYTEPPSSPKVVGTLSVYYKRVEEKFIPKVVCMVSPSRTAE